MERKRQHRVPSAGSGAWDSALARHPVLICQLPSALHLLLHSFTHSSSEHPPIASSRLALHWRWGQRGESHQALPSRSSQLGAEMGTRPRSCGGPWGHRTSCAGQGRPRRSAALALGAEWGGDFDRLRSIPCGEQLYPGGGGDKQGRVFGELCVGGSVWGLGPRCLRDPGVPGEGRRQGSGGRCMLLL